MLCPECHADSAHRSHRKGLKEHVLSLFDRYPYRCSKCKHRFLARRHTEIPPTPGATHVEAEIKATRAAVRRKLWRREMLLYASGLILFLFFLYFITRGDGGPAAGP